MYKKWEPGKQSVVVREAKVVRLFVYLVLLVCWYVVSSQRSNRSIYPLYLLIDTTHLPLVRASSVY